MDDTPDAAKTIALRQTQSRSLHWARDVDWARFTLATTSGVVLETAGSAGDTVMWLYGPNSSTRQIAFNDEGGEGSFSSIAVKGLAAGTYYVKVEQFEGEWEREWPVEAYTLALTARPAGPPIRPDAFEADSSAGSAKVIRVVTGQNRTIHTRGDIDWVKFTLTKTTSVVIRTDSPSGDTTLRLYGRNSATRLLASDSNSGTGSFSRIVARRLRRGTYYIRVEETGSDATIASYRLLLSRRHDAGAV